MFGVFRVKNHDCTPKNHIFPILGGGGRGRRGRPALDPPLHINMKMTASYIYIITEQNR
jgi:hypothetical protein